MFGDVIHKEGMGNIGGEVKFLDEVMKMVDANK